MMRCLCVAIFLLMLHPRNAAADRIQQPCDKDLSLGLGIGSFSGRTSGIEFRREQMGVLRAEIKLTSDQCKGGKIKRKRSWFNRVNLYFSINPEESNLAYEQTPGIVTDDMGNPVYQTVGNCDSAEPDCEYVRNENGEKVPKTKDTLTRADLHAGKDWSAGIGLRVSIYDGPNFHLELFGEIGGSPLYSPAYIDSLSAHVLEIDLDVTAIGREHVDVRYRWWMYHAGLTLGVPIRTRRLANRPFIPYVMIGYIGFTAKIKAEVDDELRRDLEAVKAEVALIEEPRTIRKHSPTISLGARYDPSKYLTFEMNAMYGYTGSTTVFWYTVSGTVRFELF